MGSVVHGSAADAVAHRARPEGSGRDLAGGAGGDDPIAGQHASRLRSDAHQKPGQLKQRPAEQAKKTGRGGRQGEELNPVHG